MTPITYREAVLSDIPQIASICFGYFPHLDVGMPESKLDKDAVVEHLCNRINHTNPPMILAELGDKIIGLYGLELERYWWSDTSHVTDYIWYVVSEHRNLNIGSELRKEAELWCDNHGFHFRPTVLNIDRLDAKDRAFRMGGYTRVGSVYAKL